MNDTKKKQKINWISCKERLPKEKDIYLVIIKQKYDWETEWEYYRDVAMSDEEYIDNFWATFNDWYEGQETHIIYWAKIPFPTDLIKSIDENAKIYY